MAKPTRVASANPQGAKRSAAGRPKPKKKKPASLKNQIRAIERLLRKVCKYACIARSCCEWWHLTGIENVSVWPPPGRTGCKDPEEGAGKAPAAQRGCAGPQGAGAGAQVRRAISQGTWSWYRSHSSHDRSTCESVGQMPHVAHPQLYFSTRHAWTADTLL